MGLPRVVVPHRPWLRGSAAQVLQVRAPRHFLAFFSLAVFFFAFFAEPELDSEPEPEPESESESEPEPDEDPEEEDPWLG